MEFIVKQSRNGSFYWHLRSDNNKVVASGRGFNSYANAVESIKLVKSLAASAPIVRVK